MVNDQLMIHWCEKVFQLDFLCILWLKPNIWFEVPIGSSTITDEVPVEMKSKIEVKYRLDNKDYCLIYSVASALNYMGHKKEALLIVDDAAKYEALVGELAFDKVKQLMKTLMPQVGIPETYNKHRKRKKTVQLTPDDLCNERSKYLHLICPVGKDSSRDHAICVDDLIFDARYKVALKLSIASLHFICGGEGMHKLGTVL